jgi:hypothetical protein
VGRQGARHAVSKEAREISSHVCVSLSMLLYLLITFCNFIARRSPAIDNDLSGPLEHLKQTERTNVSSAKNITVLHLALLCGH